MKMNINTKKYIEEYLKIRDKKSQIIDFKLNTPQQKLYNVNCRNRKRTVPPPTTATGLPQQAHDALRLLYHRGRQPERTKQ